MGAEPPSAMASTLSPNTATGTPEPPTPSGSIQNAADISVIVIYFIGVMAVGLWVCGKPIRFEGVHQVKGKCLMVGEVYHDKLRQHRNFHTYLCSLL
jgi:hypothetical protein